MGTRYQKRVLLDFSRWLGCNRDYDCARNQLVRQKYWRTYENK